MDASPEAQLHPDGRVARRQRNQQVVLDTVLEMFAEDLMFPSIEQVSKRSGLSLRSLYRYFADASELVEAAARHHRQQAFELTHLSRIGEGPFGQRVDDFVAMRLRLHGATHKLFRAMVVNSPTNPGVRDELQMYRRLLHEQFKRHFASEVAAMPQRERFSAVEAGNTITQIDSIELLRRDRSLTAAETGAVLTSALVALLGPKH